MSWLAGAPRGSYAGHVSVIGDLEPEDAYDASDPLDVRLEVIARVWRARIGDDDEARRHRRFLEVRRLLDNIVDELLDDGDDIDRVTVL